MSTDSGEGKHVHVGTHLDFQTAHGEQLQSVASQHKRQRKQHVDAISVRGKVAQRQLAFAAAQVERLGVDLAETSTWQE